MQWIIIIYTFFILFVNNGLGFNILAIVLAPMRSHYLAFKPLFRELANRGHSVTVINNFPDDEPLQNLRFIDANVSSVVRFPSLKDEEASFLGHLSYIRRWLFWATNAFSFCESLLIKENLAEEVKYDVVFVEQFLTSDCDLAYAGTFFDVPIIGITSHVLLPQSYWRLGIPFNVAADPYYFSYGGPNPTLLFKIEAILGNLCLNRVGSWMVQKRVYESFNKRLPNVNLEIERLARERVKMMFVYQHYSVTGARLTTPSVVEIGGMHITASKPVSKVRVKSLVLYKIVCGKLTHYLLLFILYLVLMLLKRALQVLNK